MNYPMSRIKESWITSSDSKTHVLYHTRTSGLNKDLNILDEYSFNKNANYTR